jgi:hypothetical protein
MPEAFSSPPARARAETAVNQFLAETARLRRKKSAARLLEIVTEAIETAVRETRDQVVALTWEMHQRGATGIQMTWRYDVGAEWGCYWSTESERLYTFNQDLVAALEAALASKPASRGRAS